MMPMLPRGRRPKYSDYDDLVRSLPSKMLKRPKYLRGIGVFHGTRGDTAWVKIHLPTGTTFRSKSYAPGTSLELKLGRLPSWSWQQLEAKHTELQGKADRGEPLEVPPAPTFEEWAADWLDRARVRIRAHDTAETHIRKHLVPTFGAKPLDSITVLDINRWIAAQRRTLEPGTVKRQFNTLRAILNDARRAEVISNNPCALTDPIRGAVARQRVLIGQELVTLLAAAEDAAKWLPDFILWSLYSGMRRGETLNLRWEDIVPSPDGGYVVQITNSKTQSPRSFACTSAMLKIVEARKGLRQESEFVFPISVSALTWKWNLARKKAKLGDLRIHDLRRTHATYAAGGGVDLRSLAGRLGHSDLTMLHRNYAVFNGSADAVASAQIDAALDRLTNPEPTQAGNVEATQKRGAALEI